MRRPTAAVLLRPGRHYRKELFHSGFLKNGYAVAEQPSGSPNPISMARKCRADLREGRRDSTHCRERLHRPRRRGPWPIRTCEVPSQRSGPMACWWSGTMGEAKCSLSSMAKDRKLPSGVAAAWLRTARRGDAIAVGVQHPFKARGADRPGCTDPSPSRPGQDGPVGDRCGLPGLLRITQLDWGHGGAVHRRCGIRGGAIHGRPVADVSTSGLGAVQFNGSRIRMGVPMVTGIVTAEANNGMNIVTLRHPVKLWRWYKRAAKCSRGTDACSRHDFAKIYKPQLCTVGRVIVWFLRRYGAKQWKTT